MKPKGQWSLEHAEKVAQAVVKRLSPYCAKIEIAGSIRRRKPWVNDIDICLIPADAWRLRQEIMGLGAEKMSGNKISRTMVNGIQVDLYFATPETWATLLLIRTGSVESNIRLCSIAKKKGWHLAADGGGLFNEVDQRIAGDTERSIYKALGLSFQLPEERG